MKKMTSNEIRNMYLQYFKDKGHLIVESASLIPLNDPTLLWVNAGITPLKKYFDGSAIPENRRMVSCQKCIRTNDIDNVGKTARHHTFFEMLGNFSIGDYFKKEAISFTYELLTSENFFGFDKNKLYVTIYPQDKEAYDLWIKVGIDASHIVKVEGNFWEIGEGPCGPDTEVFYDRGIKYDPENRGIELIEKDIENDRYIEIWNNVFSMYNAKSGQKREEYAELPSKNIDTGMGLERMACIIQKTETNYETDLFMPIIKKVEIISGKKYQGDMAFKVIVDHIRAITFALNDGASFSNEGRGYVLRRLLRRAVRYGQKLDITKPFVHSLVETVVDIMKDNYDDLDKNKFKIEALVLKEEELFHRTLLSGENKLKELMTNNPTKKISGNEAFKLYDTYGFPFELTLEYLEEKGFSVSKEEFDENMLRQKEAARQARKNENSMNVQNETLLNFKAKSKFVGYDVYDCKTKVIGLIKDNKFVDELDSEGYIILEETPFYAESGGQVADTGTIKGHNFEVKVLDVTKAPHKQHLHYGKLLHGKIKLNSSATAKIDIEKRSSICRNHSATHLLQKALQEILEKNITQAGSRVDDKSLRFDFTHSHKIADEDLIAVENLVNEKIHSEANTIIKTMSLKEAKEKGAMALFEEKYGNKVRVVTLFNSVELCGGTHVKNVSDIKRFAIKTFESKGANIYRIEASTNDNIEYELFEVIKPYNDEMIKLLKKASAIVKEASDEGIKIPFDVNIDNSKPSSYNDIIYNRIEVSNVRNKVKDLEKEYTRQRQQKILSDLSSFDHLTQKNNIGEFIITKVENYDISILKQIVDNLTEKLNNGFVLIANIYDNNVNYIAKANKGLAEKVDCGAIIKELSLASSGNGGGSKIFGQGGGTNATEIDSLLDNIKTQLTNL